MKRIFEKRKIVILLLLVIIVIVGGMILLYRKSHERNEVLESTGTVTIEETTTLELDEVHENDSIVIPQENQLKDEGIEEEQVSEDTDTDGDGMRDIVEKEIGFDPYSPDTDGDGLPDGYELYTLYPILLHNGYDESAGINPEDDYDEDGLTNLEEYRAGTNPGVADTDGDNISDAEEVNNNYAVATLSDTDNDGVTDGVEMKQGMDPMEQDSDGDGILDGEEIIVQQVLCGEAEEDMLAEAGTMPILDITGKGDFTCKIDVVDMFYNAMYANLEFLVGHPYDFRYEEELIFEHAVLNFKLSEEILKTYDIENLVIALYDEESKMLEFQDTVVDKEEKTLSAEITDLGIFMVINMEEYMNNLYSIYEEQNN